MKYLLIFLLSTSVFALDDDSFKNKDKYIFLDLIGSNEQSSFVFDITFVPPAGKKLNSGSMIRLWEKTKTGWEISDKGYTDEGMAFLSSYHLKKELKSKSLSSDLALEVDFIHCDHSGGQCKMQKYLGKIRRSPKTKATEQKLKLKI